MSRTVLTPRAQDWAGHSLAEINSPPGFEEPYGLTGAWHGNTASNCDCWPFAQCWVARLACAGAAFVTGNMSLIDGFDVAFTRLARRHAAPL